MTLSVHRESHVSITNDRLDLTVQGPHAPLTPTPAQAEWRILLQCFLVKKKNKIFEIIQYQRIEKNLPFILLWVASIIIMVPVFILITFFGVI